MASSSMFGWIMVLLVTVSGFITLIAFDDYNMQQGILPISPNYKSISGEVNFENVTSMTQINIPQFEIKSGSWDIINGKLVCTALPIYDVIWDSAAEIYFTDIKPNENFEITNVYQIENPNHCEFQIYFIAVNVDLNLFSHKVLFWNDGTHVTVNNDKVLSSGYSFTSEDNLEVITYYNYNGDFWVRVNGMDILSGNLGKPQDHTNYIVSSLTAKHGGIGTWGTGLSLVSLKTAGTSGAGISGSTASGGILSAGGFDVIAFLSGMVSVLTWGVTPSPVSTWLWTNVPPIFIVLFIVIPEFIGFFLIMQMIRGN